MTEALPKIKGFDRQGEPELRRGENGALQLMFNFMPPMSPSGAERQPELFETFEVALATFLGVAVARDDRELFIIANPKTDTAETLATYLSVFWLQHAKQLKARIAATAPLSDAPFRTAKEFLTAARKRLAGPMAELGFKKRAGQQLDFARPAPFGDHVVNIYADNFGHPYRHIVTLSVVDFRVERPYVRLAALEEQFARQLRTNARALEVADFATDGFGHTIPPSIGSPSALEAWAPRLIEEVKQTGFPWFDAMADLDTLAAVYNDISAPLPEFGDDRTACLGVILAKLTGATNIEEIAAYHRQCLAKFETPLAFPKVAEFVLNASREELLALA
jgi:hypothetical protein